MRIFSEIERSHNSQGTTRLNISHCFISLLITQRSTRHDDAIRSSAILTITRNLSQTRNESGTTRVHSPKSHKTNCANYRSATDRTDSQVTAFALEYFGNFRLTPRSPSLSRCSNFSSRLRPSSLPLARA